MENILLLGLSRQIALQRELDTVANNVANAATNGFKRSSSQFSEYLIPQRRQAARSGADQRMSFTIDRTSTLHLAQGAIERTGSPMDVAITGDAFFVVQTPAGERYTRNGSLSLNSSGQLVNSDGHPMLSEQGPLAFTSADGAITVASDGSLTTAQGVRGRLRLVRFTTPQSLVSGGANLFSTGETPQSAGPLARLEPGSLERSNVSPVNEIARMIEVSRSYTSLSQLMQRSDELRRSAIAKLAEAA